MNRQGLNACTENEDNISCTYIQSWGCYSYRARRMSSQLVRPNLTLRTMQLNMWVADNFMNIEILFLPLIL